MPPHRRPVPKADAPDLRAPHTDRPLARPILPGPAPQPSLARPPGVLRMGRAAVERRAAAVAGAAGPGDGATDQRRPDPRNVSPARWRGRELLPKSRRQAAGIRL